MQRTQNSVPVAVAAKAYGKDPSWVRAGIITGYLPIGTATRGGKKVTSIDEMDSKLGRINYYISPKLLFEETGYKWEKSDEKFPSGIFEKNFIDKARFLELKYFTMQYPIWNKNYKLLEMGSNIPLDSGIFVKKRPRSSDPTARAAIAREYYKSKMNLVEEACKEAAEGIYWRLIFGKVVYGMSNTKVKEKYHENCSDELLDKLTLLYYVKLHGKRD